MEEKKTNVSEIFAEMDKAVEGFFNAVKKIEEEKMVFVITRTKHYKGENPKGVKVVECFDFNDLKDAGVNVEGSFTRARFGGDKHRWYKKVADMTCGTILKLQVGEYIQRIK